jgi:hypothetical protein
MRFEPIRAALFAEGVSLETIEAFRAYHVANPEVWKHFEEFAIDAIQSKAKIGAKGIFERVRWEVEVAKRGEFAVNNNFASYYARVFELKYTQHRGFFEKRTVKGLKAA